MMMIIITIITITFAWCFEHASVRGDVQSIFRNAAVPCQHWRQKAVYLHHRAVAGLPGAPSIHTFQPGRRQRQLPEHLPRGRYKVTALYSHCWLCWVLYRWVQWGSDGYWGLQTEYLTGGYSGVLMAQVEYFTGEYSGVLMDTGGSRPTPEQNQPIRASQLIFSTKILKCVRYVCLPSWA